ncbi:NADH-quinone oxidoreductase subunit M [Blochmannia endosymbiont of Camponotus (Colobopsis) obliquus]|uniref:NADH-quinone oxidoreductase subunit M n=1 Tax=Blochmannia endosymbiont of Camponotus (Colobopsis) obliquus TaxID=1505597 RepID=UPI00061A6DFD|nr:NADH-quinone oxidoreductase subunit M [Blochmannia endosymbiont of Camponotus (Colobopsis) obliquus]AKC60634.1 NADH-quinone oxidoreductase subunit M [Blochmannia endosymbiont of Camponotus (Colobopsis) obliquus]
MFLFCLIFIPFVTGLLCWQSERISTSVPRWLALIGLGIFFFFIFLLCNKLQNISSPIDGFSRWKLEFCCSWIKRFGINFHLVLDDLSLLMILLSGFLGVFSVLCSWQEIKNHQGLFYLNILFILGSSIGIFLAADLFLFFFFWEIILIPMYFLISFWGHKDIGVKFCIEAATKFFIYSQMSGLVLLIAIFGLVVTYYNIHGVWTFSYVNLLHTVMTQKMEFLLMLGFFLAFAIKMPVVPLHGWLPDVHVQVPTAGSVDLVGILLKTSVYGLLRFNIVLFPHASKHFALFAMCLGIINIFYGSWMAFSQNDIKKFIAYSNISHMGFLLLAIYSGSQLAYQGIIIQILSYSISSAGMFIICGQLYERLHTRDIRLMGGLWEKLNFIPALFLFFVVAMLGFPGTGNFVGEMSILFGCFQIKPYITIIATFGLVFISVCFLFLVQRICYGSSIHVECLSNATFREQMILIVLMVSLLFLGIFPQLIIEYSSLIMNNISSCFITRYY